MNIMSSLWVSENLFVVIPAIVISLCGLKILYSAVIYPFLLSPLRKSPGPPLSLLGSLLSIGHVREIMSLPPPMAQLQWYRKYAGPDGMFKFSFFFNYERVLVTKSADIKRVLSTHSYHYGKPKVAMDVLTMIMGKGSLLTSEGDEHKRLRRLTNPAFRHGHIKALLPAFVRHIIRLAASWRADIAGAPGGTFVDKDVHVAFTQLTFDIIMETAFGINTNNVLGKDEAIYNAFADVLGSGSLTWRRFIPKFQSLPIESARNLRRSKKFLNDLCYEIIASKRALIKSGQKLGEDDLLSVLLSYKDDSGDSVFTDSELKDQVMAFMTAGHETTSVCLSWTFWALANHQDVQEELRREIECCFPTDPTAINADEFLSNEFPYTLAVIKESLRLFPPVPITSREALDDHQLGDHFIPRGTPIIISPGVIHMLPELWGEDVEEFKPQRFLNEDDVDTEIRRFRFIPFLAGPRVCIGDKFAMAEMKAAMCILIREFRVNLIPGHPPPEKKLKITMRPHPTLRVRISRT